MFRSPIFGGEYVGDSGMEKRSEQGWRKRRAYHARYQRDRQFHHRALLNEIKGRQGCRECGETDFRCLDFHHRDATTKTISVGSQTHLAWAALEKELTKCDVLCSNCHRKLHYEEVSIVNRVP